MYSRELKSRKAKYGWDLGRLSLYVVEELADFKKSLKNNYSTDEYIFEAVGMNGNELRFYTDSDNIATWVRTYLQAHK